MKLSGEFELIEKIRKLLTPLPEGVWGIGDDAAILPPFKGKILACVDAMVEGVHFDLKWSRPDEIGHKALAINLSDIAAMGGQPRFALVSLGVRCDLEEEFYLALYRGMNALAKQAGVYIVGGNFSKSEKLFIDVSVLGESINAVCMRKGAQAGDLIAVSGVLGESFFGYLELKKRGRVEPLSAEVKKHLMPQPRLELSNTLSQWGVVSSMIDISDGLAGDLYHLCESSGVGALLWEKNLPKAIPLSLEEALYGGEDYELLFTFNPKYKSKVASLPVSIIGEITGKAKEMEWDSGVKIDPKKSFHHF